MRETDFGNSRAAKNLSDLLKNDKKNRAKVARLLSRENSLINEVVYYSNIEYKYKLTILRRMKKEAVSSVDIICFEPSDSWSTNMHPMYNRCTESIKRDIVTHTKNIVSSNYGKAISTVLELKRFYP